MPGFFCWNTADIFFPATLTLPSFFAQPKQGCSSVQSFLTSHSRKKNKTFIRSPKFNLISRGESQKADLSQRGFKRTGPVRTSFVSTFLVTRSQKNNAFIKLIPEHGVS